MKYKVLLSVGGQMRKHDIYDHEANAIHEARRLSTVHERVIVRRVHNNGHPVKHADDMVIRGNTIAYA